MKTALRNGGLVVELPAIRRCLSSAVLGGGLGWICTWLNLQVERSYDCTNPVTDLRASAAGLVPPVVGMLTAAPVDRFTTGAHGCAEAVATVGLRHPIVAAGAALDPAPSVGTINLLVVVDAALSDAGLANALQTAVEAKAQALAAARVPALNGEGFATGTATDSICVACLPSGSLTYAGPATPHGGDLAAAAHDAVLRGALASSRAGSRGLHQDRPNRVPRW
ncbi:MAG: adenosylcobinamide amidohydrolase [Actinomycetota bacterium]